MGQEKQKKVLFDKQSVNEQGIRFKIADIMKGKNLMDNKYKSKEGGMKGSKGKKKNLQLPVGLCVL